MLTFIIIILICCSLPPGSHALTFDGIDDFTESDVGIVTYSNLTFTLRTRQTENAVLLTDQNFSKFKVLLKDGLLRLEGESGMFLQDDEKINDGISHTVLVQTDASTTTLSVDGNQRTSKNINLLSNSWRNLLSDKKIVVGKGQGINEFYHGCFNGLVVGGVTIDLSTATKHGGVQSGCMGTVFPCNETLSPCLNGGVCVDDFNDFKCDCTTFYTSKTCNETQNVRCEFSLNLCNDGACNDLELGRDRTFSQKGKDFFTCTCNSGYTGPQCETNINDCVGNPCVNGNCTDKVNDYECACEIGWDKKNCEHDIDECFPDPCNKQPCTHQIGNYTCDCGGIYEGRNCETDINECLNITTCSGHGNCTNLDGGFSCACDLGYFGRNCRDNNTQLCEILRPCRNGGTCEDDITGYNCTCTSTYDGVNCTNALVVEEDDNLPLVLGLSVAAAVIVLIILITCLVRYCRDKSGMEGTYSPNKEEQAGGNVEMHAIKKPKTERLI